MAFGDCGDDEALRAAWKQFSSRTTVDSDGKVRLILCRDDPGYHNWMDTQGFERGNLAYRNLLSEAQAVFHTVLVKRSELAAALP